MEAYQHKVQYYETDKMGIVHHSNYIRWMEEARMDFLAKIGWNYEKLEEMGIISPVTAVEYKYKSSTTFADVVTISVWIEEFKGVKLKLKYKMEKGRGIPVGEGRSEHCFLKENGKIVSLKRELPEVYEALMERVE